MLVDFLVQDTAFAQRIRRVERDEPGGSLPSVPILKSSADAAALAVVEQLDFGDSYALTLKEWRRRFLESWADIAPLGFDAPFRRLWEFYLCYCEAGFRAGTIDVNLIALQGR
ncbi:class I SAM-dependent methyltransferase [Bosea beijingensis]|uniref:class I SAM-dependent methyltransferase n=1 Tax=Bosea beijingensis TaxID=3068632 RepID=UPI0027426BE2|nr:class I SAM-dependent methyltransferase [Bosea sp. REN20]